MIEEVRVKRETAFLANEKGFNKYSRYGYINKIGSGYIKATPFERDWNQYSIGQDPDKYVVAPTQSVLQKWLRENYHFNFLITERGENGWVFDFTQIIDGAQHSWSYATFYEYTTSWESYESALEVALVKALELI